MSDSIYAEFNYAGGIVEAEISAKSSRITFHRGDEEVVIEEAYGDVFRFDNDNFTLLTEPCRNPFVRLKRKSTPSMPLVTGSFLQAKNFQRPRMKSLGETNIQELSDGNLAAVTEIKDVAGFFRELNLPDVVGAKQRCNDLYNDLLAKAREEKGPLYVCNCGHSQRIRGDVANTQCPECRAWGQWEGEVVDKIEKKGDV